MSMPSPYELGAKIGSNVAGGIQQGAETTMIDRILSQASQSGNPEDIQNVMGQILQRVAPERQQIASQILQNQVNQLQQKRTTAQRSEALQQEGLNPNLPESVLKEQAKQKFAPAGAKLNPEVQKWAYKELEKKAPLGALKNSLTELKRLNASGATGPVVGNIPSAFASTEEDAIRKAIDANAIQILNVHKSMFPRGLTQGEFKTLSQKLVSSKNTQLANDQIIDAYEKLSKLQEQKINAVEEAVQKYGFDPMLPFIVSGIQKQYDEQEEIENRKLFEKVTGEKSGEKESSSFKGRSLQEIFS